jgi:predicted XRE-type DNA-binding protein
VSKTAPDVAKKKPMRKWQLTSTVLDALAASAKETANMTARCDLMIQIAEIVKSRHWTQTEAAAHCGIGQPRMNHLLRGQIDRFSLDALVNIASALGQRVRVVVEAE